MTSRCRCDALTNWAMKPLTLGGPWKKPICSREFFSGFFTQLHKLRSLRRSFLHFHFISAVQIWFISYIINIMLATCVHWQEVNYGKLNSLQKEQPLQDKWERTSLLGGRKSDYSKSFPTGFENFFISRASLKHGDRLYKEPWTGRAVSSYQCCKVSEGR